MVPPQNPALGNSLPKIDCNQPGVLKTNWSSDTKSTARNFPEKILPSQVQAYVLPLQVRFSYHGKV